LVAAHRGDWRGWPENSLPGFQSVIDMGCDIVELDLQKTKDNVLVVCHDGTLNRTTNGTGKISEMTYEEISKYCLRLGHGGIADTHIPTLRQALEVCKDKIIVNIDKGYSYYDEVLELAEEMGVTGQILLKGASPKANVDKKFASHQHNTLYLPIINLSNEKNFELLDSYLYSDDVPIAYEICWKEEQQVLAEDVCNKIINQGSKVYINTLWPSLNGGYCDDAATKDADKVYGKILDMGATIIQTDRPELLIRWLHKHHRHKAFGKPFTQVP